MASLINHIVGWWRRPIIKVELVPDVGCYVTTKRGNPPTHDAKTGMRNYEKKWGQDYK